MNLNANDEYENLFDADDETDLWFMTKAIECHLLMQQEGQGSTSRNPIYREYEDAEEDFNDIQNLYVAHNTVHRLPKMLRGIDCMHWEWTKCSKAWHDQFERGDNKYPTTMLALVALYDWWIWHVFFGVTGANNDQIVFNNSPLFDDLLNNIALVAPFLVNGVQYEKGYYLGDGMYLQWAMFVESFMVARDEKLGFLNGENKLQERMSNEFLVFSKDVGELYNIRRLLIISTRYEESCIVASYCII
ncbi:ALP1-like protein [Tanacetum coccineum]